MAETQDQLIAENKPKTKSPNLFGLLKPYTLLVVGLIVMALAANGLNLVMPKIMAHAVDTYRTGQLDLKVVAIQFFLASFGLFFFTYLQSVLQTYAAEKVAKDLRAKLIEKISRQNYAYIQKTTSSKLLTNLTSDIDAIKLFISQAFISIISSAFLIVGAAILLLTINWKLALAILAILPTMGIAFYFVFSKMGPLFKKSQEVIDWLNRVINESILGASLIRVLNGIKEEERKFVEANTQAKDLGLSILKLFAGVIPIIGLVANLATLVILILGGHFVISSQMSLGDFTAFMSYLIILIFPIILIGFMSSSISRSQASYGRVSDTLNAPNVAETGSVKTTINGDVFADKVSLSLDQKRVLNEVSFMAKAGSKTAILGPTAAGKTHLLYLLIGLIDPDQGVISYDGTALKEYNKDTLHEQVGFVFQDSIIFNMTLRENIGFSTTVTDADLEKAIETAELKDFVATLPKKLDTIVSERGSTLSGGQKQRIMLARALALNPKVLLLDDFTARIDSSTEKKVLANIEKNYPGLTLISVTQKVASVEHYDQIILLMEGEVLAIGTHAKLMEESPEYVQIFNSQRSTSHYELPS